MMRGSDYRVSRPPAIMVRSYVIFGRETKILSRHIICTRDHPTHNGQGLTSNYYIYAWMSDVITIGSGPTTE